jgi:hypothetical protein
VTTPPFDVAKAHRWFAVELNNLAWNLVEAPQRSSAEVEQMIHAAHGACYHWLQVGDVLNHLRAQCLLSTAYTTAGYGEAAIRHAEKCLTLSTEAADQQTPFDRATAHGCAAAAYRLVGDAVRAKTEYEEALAAGQKLNGPEEIEVFRKLYAR